MSIHAPRSPFGDFSPGWLAVLIGTLGVLVAAGVTAWALSLA